MKTKLYTAGVIAAAGIISATAQTAEEALLVAPEGSLVASSDTIFSANGSRVVLNYDLEVPGDVQLNVRVLGVEFTSGFNLHLDVRSPGGAWQSLFSGDGGDVNPQQVLGNIELQPGEDLEVRAFFDGRGKRGDTFTHTGQDTNNIVVVSNGDSIPDRLGLDNQRAVHDVLNGFVDADGSAFTLGVNDRLILAEVGTTNTNSPAFDLQDIVVHLEYTPVVSK